jgi:hypothetical protein
MTPRHAAVGLASLGRRGDSTLVHMAPREVEALDRLGARYGKRITRNPDTGLPEAFDFLNLLPAAVGLVTAPFLGPIGAALASGVTAGAKTAAQGGGLGDIALSAGISGMGSFAGSGLMDAAAQGAEGAASLATPASVDFPGGSIVPPIPPSSIPNTVNSVSLGEAGRLQSLGQDVAGLGANTTTATAAPVSESFWDKGIANIQSIPDKLSAIADQPQAALEGAWGYIKDNPMKAMGLGASMLGVGNYNPQQQQPNTSQKPTLRPGFGQKWTPTYNTMPDNFNPALNGPGDYGFTYSPPIVPGPLNFAQGGEVDGMADGGMASIDPVNLDPLSRLSQSIAQNNNINMGISTQPTSMQQGQQSNFFKDAMSAALQDAMDRGNRSTPLVPGTPGAPGAPGASGTAQYNGGSDNTTSEGSGSGGDVGDAGKSGGLVRGYFDGGSINQNISGFPPDTPGLNMQRTIGMARGGLASIGGESDNYTRNTVSEAIRALSGGHPNPTSALQNFSDTFGHGALSALQNKFGGGRIKGPGGGLDDLVGGTIEGKQQVRLADGEFVVPADVVSGLGGGSTDKGVHELKGMMNRVRMDATGRSKQINRVNPRKVLPA